MKPNPVGNINEEKDNNSNVVVYGNKNVPNSSKVSVSERCWIAAINPRNITKLLEIEIFTRDLKLLVNILVW